MKTATICILLNNDYWGTIYSFERIGFSIVEKETEIILKDAPKEYIKVIGNVEVELVVGYTNSTDKRLIDYFTTISSAMVDVTGVGYAEANNRLFACAKNQYVCVLPSEVFLQPHWLTELICHYELVQKSGIVGICNEINNNIECLPLTDNDNENFINVFVPVNNLIDSNGVYLFLREYLNYVGGFDTSVELTGNELNQLQLRFLALGYRNYYIPTQSAIVLHKTQVEKERLEISNKNLTATLLEMKERKNYYLPIKS